MRVGQRRFVRIAGLSLVVTFTLSLGAWSAEHASGWQTDFSAAQATARRLGQPLLVHFYATWCGPCQRMERETLSRPQLRRQIQGRMIGIKIDSDQHENLVERFQVTALPCDIIVAPDGHVLARHVGYQTTREYLTRIARIDTQFAASRKTRLVNNRRRLGSAAAGSSTKSDRRSVSPAVEIAVTRPENFIGLNGYSPVSLEKTRKWARGRREFSAKYKGITYRLVTAAELAAFRAHPARYAPRLLGCDPVVLSETDRAVPGSTRFGAYFNSELYLFVNAQSRSKFHKNPTHYTRTRYVLRLNRIGGTRLQ